MCKINLTIIKQIANEKLGDEYIEKICIFSHFRV
jgi:hypothetical protein